MATYKQSGEVQALLSARLICSSVSMSSLGDPYLEDFQHLYAIEYSERFRRALVQGVKNV